MKYESPEIKVVELDAVDIIQTSGVSTGGENDTPFNPASTTYDNLNNTSIY